ncbi:MAG: glutamate decarboxylase [Solirubrobacterales bacterium]
MHAINDFYDGSGDKLAMEKLPTERLYDVGMGAEEARMLIEAELFLDSDPMRNLATFVTTWMEPSAQRLIADNLHRNFIDHAEYPQTAEIEQRCIRILADLFNAPGETTGARTQGSSEAIMLGALNLKWNWRKRREAEGKDTTKPNLVFGGDVHVVWDKFCRYFDVEPRIVPLSDGKYTIDADDVKPFVDENTIGVAAVVGTTFTGHSDDVEGINDMLVALREETGLDVPMHVDGASGAFVWPFLYPDVKWDFRLEQVRSINASGHKFGLVYPGVGWVIFREKADLCPDLVFMENYLGKEDATFTLNFSTGSSMLLAQYYQFVRLGRAGYAGVIKLMAENAIELGRRIKETGYFDLVLEGDPQLPLVAFKLNKDYGFDEYDVAAALSATRGWMVPAYSLPANAEDVVLLRALVKESFTYTMVETLAQDIENACKDLEQTGGLHEIQRKRLVKSNPHI